MLHTQLIMSIPYLPLLAVCGLAAYRYRQFSRANKVLAWFVFLTTPVQLVSFALWSKQLNNLPISHFYTAASFVVIMWYYREVLRTYISDAIFKWTAGLFVAFAVANAVWLQPLLTFNSYPLTVQCVVVIIFAMATHIVLLEESVQQEKRGQLRSLRWVNNGFFIFFACTILLFHFGKVIIDSFSTEASVYSWMLHSFFATVLYSCLFIGLWIQPRK